MCSVYSHGLTVIDGDVVGDTPVLEAVKDVMCVCVCVDVSMCVHAWLCL